MENSIQGKTKQDKREATAGNTVGNKKELSNKKTVPASDNVPAEY